MQHGASPEGSSKEMCPLLMASNIQGVLSITLIPTGLSASWTGWTNSGPAFCSI